MQKWWRLGATLYTLVIFGTMVIIGIMLIIISRSAENEWDEGLLLNLGTEVLGGAFLFWLLSLGWEGYKNLAQRKTQQYGKDELLNGLVGLTQEVRRLQDRIKHLEDNQALLGQNNIYSWRDQSDSSLQDSCFRLPFSSKDQVL